MKVQNIAAMLASTVIVASCGGGGKAAPAVPVAPVPVVTLAASQTTVSLGASATLAWSSANATSCTASGAWSGTQATAGTSSQSPAVPGRSTYTLTCASPGGTASQSVVLSVPIPVEKSSYENKAIAGEVLGPQLLPREVLSGNAVAFADFFQDGSYSMVTHSLEYNASDISTADKLGRIRFYRNTNGAWIDNTPALLANNIGCLHPRKASVADFNGDGRPDIFFACHGFDAPPFAGESPLILLSQTDGTYKSAVVPVTCFCHSASAADVDGDGYPDVLVTGDKSAGVPFFLINKKDGTFTQDLARLPADVRFKPIFTSEMIDFAGTGKYDVFLGGHEQDPSASWPATILPNDGAGNFAAAARFVLPAAEGYGFPTDIVYKAGAIYLARTIDASSDFYGGAAIQKIAYPSLAAQTLYQHNVAYPSGTRWINWIMFKGGAVTTVDAAYGISLPQ